MSEQANPAGEIAALVESSWSSQHADPATAIALANRGIALARQHGDMASLALALLGRGMCELRHATAETARETLLEAASAFERSGHERGRLLAHAAGAGALARLERSEDTADRMEQALQGLSACGDPLDRHLARWLMDEIRYRTQVDGLHLALRQKDAEIARLRNALQDQAILDPLTGLHNRRFLQAQVESVLAQAERAGYALCMVMLDIDNFANINDMLGRGFGDQVLITLAALLRRQIRNTDLAIRYGGEEFCLVFPMSSAHDTRARMEYLLNQFHTTAIMHGDKSLTGLAFSAGVAQLFVHGTSSDELVRMAEDAMIRAKNEGRNRVEIADQPHV